MKIYNFKEFFKGCLINYQYTFQNVSDMKVLGRALGLLTLTLPCQDFARETNSGKNETNSGEDSEKNPVTFECVNYITYFLMDQRQQPKSHKWL